jgi:hypothetical protein
MGRIPRLILRPWTDREFWMIRLLEAFAGLVSFTAGKSKCEGYASRCS